MKNPKTEQRHLQYRGRQFHFVSYEGQDGNAARLQPPTGPAWFLMGAGKRWLAMPHDPEQAADEVDRLLAEWLDAHVFA